jgi:Leucine-rich repeat (LRR) protein
MFIVPPNSAHHLLHALFGRGTPPNREEYTVPGITAENAPAHANRIREIKLTDDHLSHIPEWIFEIAHLLVLKIKKNPVTEIPPAIDRLRWLQVLHVSYAQIRVIPAGLSTLITLTNLSFSHNPIDVVPTELFKLTRLKVLNLNDCNYSELPEELGELKGLENLGIASTPLKRLPQSIGALARLQRLNAFDCQLVALPSSFTNLGGLEHLHLANNRFTSLNNLTRHLPRLKTLFIGQNPLSQMEPWQGSPYLEGISLNSLSILNWQGPSFITKVSLRNCSLTAIPSWVLNKTVTILDLGHNNISRLPVEMRDQDQLEELDLSHNSLEDIALLSNLASLKMLVLATNGISEIPNLNLPRLSQLDLSNNLITTLSEALLNLRCKVHLLANPIFAFNRKPVIDAYQNGFEIKGCPFDILMTTANLAHTFKLAEIAAGTISKWFDRSRHEVNIHFFEEILNWLAEASEKEQESALLAMQEGANSCPNILRNYNNRLKNLKRVSDAAKTLKPTELAQLIERIHRIELIDAWVNKKYGDSPDVEIFRMTFYKHLKNEFNLPIDFIDNTNDSLITNAELEEIRSLLSLSNNLALNVSQNIVWRAMMEQHPDFETLKEQCERDRTEFLEKADGREDFFEEYKQLEKTKFSPHYQISMRILT